MSLSFPPNAALERLLREQAALLECFTEARDAGITTDAGVSRLQRSRTRLQDHLAIVDIHVYPLLRRLAANDARVRRGLGQAEAADVSAQVQEFFDTGCDPTEPSFFTAWGALYVAVQRRFRLERTVLFPALAGSALSGSLQVPAPAARITTGPVAVTELHKRSWRHTP